MKVYVRGYWELEEKELLPQRAPFGRVENTEVGYAREPQLKFPTRDVTDFHCARLRQMGVHIDAHFCDFEVEELPEGDFTIVCISHPDYLKVLETLS